MIKGPIGEGSWSRCFRKAKSDELVSLSRTGDVDSINAILKEVSHAFPSRVSGRKERFRWDTVAATVLAQAQICNSVQENAQVKLNGLTSPDWDVSKKQRTT